MLRTEAAIMLFFWGIIDKSAERCGTGKSDKTACGHNIADVFGCPLLLLQINAQKRAESVVDVGK